MGYLNALDMAGAAPSIEVALSWHLQSNHYPPVHRVFIPVAVAAIEAGKEEDWDRVIELPEGASVNDQTAVRAGDIVEWLHLDAFIDYDEEREDDDVDEEGNFLG